MRRTDLTLNNGLIRADVTAPGWQRFKCLCTAVVEGKLRFAQSGLTV